MTISYWRETPPLASVLTAVPSHPSTFTSQPNWTLIVYSSISSSAALPDYGLKWVMYLAPGSASTTTCSSTSVRLV